MYELEKNKKVNIQVAYHEYDSKNKRKADLLSLLSVNRYIFMIPPQKEASKKINFKSLLCSLTLPPFFSVVVVVKPI